MASYNFHPDALVEFEDATRYYLEQASPIVASAFVAAVESAIKTVINLTNAFGLTDFRAHRSPEKESKLAKTANSSGLVGQPAYT